MMKLTNHVMFVCKNKWWKAFNNFSNPLWLRLPSASSDRLLMAHNTCALFYHTKVRRWTPLSYHKATGAYLKSLKSKAVIVSRTENCSTSNLRITTTRCIRVTILSIFLSSLTWWLRNETLRNQFWFFRSYKIDYKPQYIPMNVIFISERNIGRIILLILKYW